MKKTFLKTILTLCLGFILVGCGNTPEPVDKVDPFESPVGLWMAEKVPVTFVIDEDGTATSYSAITNNKTGEISGVMQSDCTWAYDSNSHVITFTDDEKTFEMEISVKDGVVVFGNDKITYIKYAPVEVK